MLKLSKAKYLWTGIERNINIPQGKNYIAFLILNGATRSRKWCELKFLSLSEKTETQKRTAESQKTLNRNILQLPISYVLPKKKGFMRYLSQSDDELMSLVMLLHNGTAKITNKLPSRRMCYRFGQKAERTWIGCKEGFPPRPTNKSYLDIGHKTVSLFFIYQ